MGSGSAAQVATWLMSSFSGVKIAFLVGICGVVPSYWQEEKRDTWLGDCHIHWINHDRTMTIQISIQASPLGIMNMLTGRSGVTSYIVFSSLFGDA